MEEAVKKKNTKKNVCPECPRTNMKFEVTYFKLHTSTENNKKSYRCDHYVK